MIRQQQARPLHDIDYSFVLAKPLATSEDVPGPIVHVPNARTWKWKSLTTQNVQLCGGRSPTQRSNWHLVFTHFSARSCKKFSLLAEKHSLPLRRLGAGVAKPRPRERARSQDLQYAAPANTPPARVKIYRMLAHTL